MKRKLIGMLMLLVMLMNMLPGISVVSYAQDEENIVESLLSSMSLREKVTQMMMVDFRKWGSSAEDAVDFTEMNDEVYSIVSEYKFGAVILFSNNVKETEQTFRLTQSLQEAATKNNGIPLIITADQEGGNVVRLGSGTALPGNMALGATYAANGTKYAKAAGQIIGSELSVLGINANLAPVVDINSNANNPVIGLRSFGDDPDVVGELASAMTEGLAEYHVIGTAKHFPGHGDTATDSHYGLPVVEKSLAELEKNELKPFDILISQGIEMIMTAHILYPQLESDRILSNKTGELESLPATMSDDILTNLLKGDMGFDGIVVTDAMNMAGITENWDAVQAAMISVQAGADMICMPTRLYCKEDLANLDAVIEGIIDAVNSGEIPQARIDDAVRRILTVKNKRGILDYDSAALSIEKAKEIVGCAANRATEREMAAAAVTLIKNENEVLPLKLASNSRVLMLVAFDDESALTLMGWNRAKAQGLIPSGAEVDYYRFNAESMVDGAFVPELQEKLDAADTLIIISECGSVARMEYKHWLTAVPNALCNYASSCGKTSIVISADKPYDVQLYPAANAILATYGCRGSSVDPTTVIIGEVTGEKNAYGPNILAAVEVVLGTYSPSGKLPLNIPVYDLESNSYTSSLAFERGYGLSYAVVEDIPGTDTLEDTATAEPDMSAPETSDVETFEENTTDAEVPAKNDTKLSAGTIIVLTLAAAVLLSAVSVTLILLIGKRYGAR